MLMWWDRWCICLMRITPRLSEKYVLESPRFTHTISGSKTNLQKEYEARWNQSTTTLSVLLDKMLDYVDYLSQYTSEIEILKIKNQQIEIYSRMIELDMNNSSQYSLDD